MRALFLYCIWAFLHFKGYCGDEDILSVLTTSTSYRCYITPSKNSCSSNNTVPSWYQVLIFGQHNLPLDRVQCYTSLQCCHVWQQKGPFHSLIFLGVKQHSPLTLVYFQVPKVLYDAQDENMFINISRHTLIFSTVCNPPNLFNRFAQNIFFLALGFR